MRLLGVDLGARRIGLATADSASRVAVPIGAIDRRSEGDAVHAVADAASKRDAEIIVVGLPLTLRGRVSAQTQEALAFADGLAQRTGLRVETWDERLTSVEADRRLNESHASRGALGAQDAMAAALILQAYMDATRP